MKKFTQTPLTKNLYQVQKFKLISREILLLYKVIMHSISKRCETCTILSITFSIFLGLSIFMQHFEQVIKKLIDFTIFSIH